MATGDRVLITGASGFVGSAVLRALISRGFLVRALVRSSSPRTNLAGIACDIVDGDMRSLDDMLRAAEGARYLFHVAADYRIWAPDPKEIVRNNLEGTRSVMTAAIRAGVEKIVYTSSVATLRPNDAGADEASRL